MRYEDMLADRAPQLRQLAKFLRLPPTEAQLKSAIGKSSFTELARQEDLRAALRPANIRNLRHLLPILAAIHLAGRDLASVAATQ